MNHFVLLVLASITFTSNTIAHAEEDFSKEIVKATMLSSSIYMLEGAGGNMTALIGPDGTLLVDDDFAPMANKLVAKLKELKGSSPRFIVNTHFHYDHTGGNKVFGTTATIIAAPEVRDRLSREQTLWKEVHPAFPAEALPTVVYDGSLNLHANNEDIKIVHYKNGHTDGDTVVFFKNSKVASLGDLYFSGMFPIFHPEHQGGLKGYVQNLTDILKEIPQEAKIVPGHGPMSGRPELEKYLHMIQISVKAVKKGIERSLTLEQIQAAGLPPECEPFSHGYVNSERWIAMLYGELRK